MFPAYYIFNGINFWLIDHLTDVPSVLQYIFNRVKYWLIDHLPDVPCVPVLYL